jgi:hypothetical protein
VLIGGYLEKVARWQSILDAAETQPKFQGARRWFRVFRSDNAYSIVFPSSWEMYDPSDKVLEVMNRTYFSDHTEDGHMLGEEFLITPGEAGKHLLGDPGDGVPLEELRIDIGSQLYKPKTPMRHIKIVTIEDRDKRASGKRFFQYIRSASYKFATGEGTLEVTHKDGLYEGMTDEMVTKLLDTIDELIPKNSNPTIQLERRAGDTRENV